MAADELVFFIVDEVVNAGVATVTLDQGSDKLSDKYMTGNEFGKWIRKKTCLYVYTRIDTHTLWKKKLSFSKLFSNLFSKFSFSKFSFFNFFFEFFFSNFFF